MAVRRVRRSDLTGAVLTSYNAGLNSAAALYAMDIHLPVINPKADAKRVGQWMQVVALVISLALVPLYAIGAGDRDAQGRLNGRVRSRLAGGGASGYPFALENGLRGPFPGSASGIADPGPPPRSSTWRNRTSQYRKGPNGPFFRFRRCKARARTRPNEMDKASQISALLAPTVASLGLELLGIEYLPAPGGAVVRLYIDYPADAAPVTGEDAQPMQPAVGIDECEQVSREVSAQLDVEDPISGNYTLEVSSPGLDRPLFTPAQFARFIGQNAKVGLKLPQDGRRRLTGRINAVEGETIRFDVDGQPFEAAFDNIDKARLVPDWAAMGYAAAKLGKKKPGAKPKPSESTKQAGKAADAESEE